MILQLEAMRDAIERGDELFNRGCFDDARGAFEGAREQGAKAAVKSAYLAWRLCATYERLEEYEMAFKYVREALQLDPLAPPFRESFTLIVKSMRRALAGALGVPAEEPWVPRYYQLLSRAGEADDAAHLAMARFFKVQGDHARALELVAALTLLSPACREAWELRATLSRALGQEQQAREAELAAAACESPELFSVPGGATA